MNPVTTTSQRNQQLCDALEFPFAVKAFSNMPMVTQQLKRVFCKLLRNKRGFEIGSQE